MLFAYIDPATGAMVMQIVAAGVLTAGVLFRRIILAPFAFFKKSSGNEPQEGHDNQND